MERKTLHIEIFGTVQMVGFRWFTIMAAQRHHIYGNVRNTYHGTVEIIAQANNSNLQLFLDELRQGPPRSNVIRLELEELTTDYIYNEFEIRG